MFKKPKLLICRGLPGSGKSHYAKKLSKQFNIKHFENDAYLYVNGEYKWTPLTAKLAAKKCFEDTMNELKAGRNAIVSNVFVRTFPYPKVTIIFLVYKVLYLFFKNVYFF